MEKRNLFVSGKAVVAAVCGAFTAAFGRLHGAGLGQRQRRRGQQGRVVERCRPGRHLA